MENRYDENYSPDELMHYGILGMRWGIRRTPEELGHEILKNEHKQAETAAKIARIEKAHEINPYKGYKKSEARVYKRAQKLRDEHENLLMDKAVAEKRQKALEAKAELKAQKKEVKEAQRAAKQAKREQAEAAKQAKIRETMNSHNLQKKPLAEMTDKELGDYLTRKANEAKYMQYNPKPRTIFDDAKDFISKNTGKVAQAAVDVGIDVGKDLIKKELTKQQDAKAANSRDYLRGKDLSQVSDKHLADAKSRLQNEFNIHNYLKTLDSTDNNSSSNQASKVDTTPTQSESNYLNQLFVSDANGHNAFDAKSYVDNYRNMPTDEWYAILNSKGLLTPSV